MRLPPAVLAAPLLASLLTAPLPGAAQSGDDAPSATPPDRLAALDGAGAAYRTSKSVFFGIRTVEVVGVTTGIALTLEPVATDDRRIARVEIDVTSFDSGNETRDGDVAGLLGGARHLPIVFRSRMLEPEELEGLLAGRTLAVDGTLSLPAGPAPLRFELAVVDAASTDGAAAGGRRVLQGVATATFDELGLDVPGVGPAGILVSPDDELELWLRVPVDDLPRPGG
jgi:hypothetical protein